MASEHLLRRNQDTNDYWTTAEFVALNYLSEYGKSKHIDGITIANETESRCFALTDSPPQSPRLWDSLVIWSNNVLRSVLPQPDQLPEAAWISSHQNQLIRAKNKEKSRGHAN